MKTEYRILIQELGLNTVFYTRMSKTVNSKKICFRRSAVHRQIDIEKIMANCIDVEVLWPVGSRLAIAVLGLVPGRAVVCP